MASAGIKKGSALENLGEVIDGQIGAIDDFVALTKKSFDFLARAHTVVSGKNSNHVGTSDKNGYRGRPL